ncbi:efflux RND transporter periplasmic adaptor subunit [Mucilaginibacter aquariorum]|uniref:Efflux RND transporter periplasmic adaptor subunit n=1 Tax=Mucilaginibacter aquariorum TaxID=2967225 RepID=A0ABT1T3H3_9SPHI|nr:efflux RND transporter periplasmic adaptor subunit [Mucilaginibacter aquariorum]MCQ6959155.1 efflux RND transporter periplasmic adaptor subunit [Mucilaginibacter aquariorum]
MKLVNYAIPLVFLISACSNKKEHTQAVIHDLTVSLYASANVKAKDQYTVISTVPGIIKQINVQPGDLVKAGDVLFVLESREATLNAANARQVLDFSLSNSQANSEQLQEALFEVQAAKDKYRLDSAFYGRQKNLWKQNIGTLLDFDQRQLAFTTSKINYDVAVKHLTQLKKKLKNDLELSRINYLITQKRATDYLIKSEIDGKAFDAIKNKGELVTTQTALGILGKPDQFYLEMNVDENDITGVKPGQLVEITMDSYKGLLFRGRVSKIYPIMDERSRTFNVEAVFSDPPAKLYPNLTAEVNIIVSVKRRALLIPRSFLDKDNCVWLKGDIKKKVITGALDEKNVEILHGLNPQETIYKPY